MKPIKVFIAGPYTKPDPCENVRNSMLLWNDLREKGFVPFSPICLAHFHHTFYPRAYEDWLSWSMSWIGSCDALIRIPGFSPGADKEESHAMSLGIPCFHTTMGLLQWREGRENNGVK